MSKYTAFGLVVGAFLFIGATSSMFWDTSKDSSVVAPCLIEQKTFPCLNELDLYILEEIGGEAVTWKWNNGDSTNTMTSLAAGTYTVTVTNAAGDTTICSYEAIGIDCTPDSCVVPSAPVVCDAIGGRFSWADTSGVGQNWNIDDSINVYSVPLTTGSLGVTVTLIDPDNRNNDNNLFTTHPFDPLAGCDPYPGAIGPSEADLVPGDGSIIDPWDSDCNYIYTQTQGQYGPDYLTFGINAYTHLEDVTLLFEFEKPIILNQFAIGDIDAQGFYYPVAAGQPVYEMPGTSYQDEVILGAESACGGEVALSYCGGDRLIAVGDTIRSRYRLAANDDVSPNALTNTIFVSSDVAITSMSITYSNGRADGFIENLYPSFYPWWTDTHGATNGVSDDQAIRLDGFDFCCCPDLVAHVASDSICSGQASVITVDSISGGVAPYAYEWPDGTSANTFSVSSSMDTTVMLIVVDGACCADTIDIALKTKLCESCTPITADIAVDSLCIGTYGTATISNPTGGTGPYSYSGLGGPFDPVVNGDQIFVTTGAAASVIITDAAGCMDTLIFSVPSKDCFGELCVVETTDCTEGSLVWEGGTGANATWAIDDNSNSYSVTTPTGSTNVTVMIIDPDNRNGDTDLHSTHPFDPAGGCQPYPGASGGSESDDDVIDNGSIVDPWDSNCNYNYSQSDGVFGPGYLSAEIVTAVSGEGVGWKYEFDKPVLLNDFCVSDIDALGLYNAVVVNRNAFETPGDSYQDMVTFSAEGTCGAVELNLCAGAGLIVDGSSVRSEYYLGTNQNTNENDLDHTVCVSSSVAITSFTVFYSNGPEDGLAEEFYPHLYEWWSDTNGPTSGASDNQTIRMSGIDFCCCPELTATLASNEICQNVASSISVTGVSGGTAPYAYEWPDGSTGEDYGVTAAADTTISLIVTDATCCIDTVGVDLIVVSCIDPCPSPNCLGITVTKN